MSDSTTFSLTEERRVSQNVEQSYVARPHIYRKHRQNCPKHALRQNQQSLMFARESNLNRYSSDQRKEPFNVDHISNIRLIGQHEADKKYLEFLKQRVEEKEKEKLKDLKSCHSSSKYHNNYSMKG